MQPAPDLTGIRNLWYEVANSYEIVCCELYKNVKEQYRSPTPKGLV